MSNRLANETSPYLQQHKDNPVDWYPWGEEALSRARREDKPILLSVGYSACHWCHVMEHESFSDADTAALMNEHFVNIKVDREERPDVDALYMQAVQQMTGHGGWPMTVFLKPDGTPFYGGTYFPPVPRHGLPSFKQVLLGVTEAYRNRRDEVEQGAAALRDALEKGMAVNPDPEPLEHTQLQQAFHRLTSRFDHTWGGFGGAPKFPQPMTLDFLLRYHARTGSEDALAMVERTLEAMARGGVYDQIGGGFHRYAVDARWLVPHFEKMLYDNGLLARIYLRAHQVTGRADFRRIAEEVLDYVLREMRDKEGGFYSSQDADSEGVEGKFYVWAAAEIDEVLGAEDGPMVRELLDITPAGNWEGTNIPNRPRTLAEVAAATGHPESRLEEVLTRARPLLYTRRAERIWPGRDEKVITSWNALMLHALAEAARVLARDDYREAASRCAEFLLRELREGDRLLRSWRSGIARTDGFLEDHALLVDALIELYSATFDPRWVEEARSIADWMIERFWDDNQELFFDTPVDGEQLVVRPRDIYDNATPSGTSAATQALIRLARLTSEPDYERIAGRVLGGMGRVAAEIPQGFGHLLAAFEHHLAAPTEVAIIGGPDESDTEALLAQLRSRFLPHTTLALGDPEAEADPGELIPLLADRPMRDGSATAYVCRHYVCNHPVTSPTDLSAQLDELVGVN